MTEKRIYKSIKKGTTIYSNNGVKTRSKFVYQQANSQPKLPKDHWTNGSWTLNINEQGRIDGYTYYPPSGKEERGRKSDSSKLIK